NEVGMAMYPKEYRQSYGSFCVMTSLHCYWKKCTFCTYTHSSHLTEKIDVTSKGNWRDLPLLIEEMRQPFTWEDGNPSNFFFIEDSAMPPRKLLDLLRGCKEVGMDLNVHAYLRFEKALLGERYDLEEMYALGLRNVFIGLEAGSQRVNDLMDKGV